MKRNTYRNFKQRYLLPLNLLVCTALVCSGLYLITYQSFLTQKGIFPHSKLDCISYDPRYQTSNFTFEELLEPSEPINGARLRRDLTQIATVANCVRTYSVETSLYDIPEIAAQNGLTVILGAKLSLESERNKRELDRMVELANEYDNIKYLVVGNEHLLHKWLYKDNGIAESDIISALRYVQERVAIPVSTAEPLHSWRRSPGLLNQVDFIALNELPYWYGVEIGAAERYLNVLFREIRRLTTKKVVISETGWVTKGPKNKQNLPSLENLSTYIAVFVDWANRNKIDYNFFEAYDQPWKRSQSEGVVGAHWGIFDAYQNLKVTDKRKQSIYGRSFALAGLLVNLLVVFIRRRRSLATNLFLVIYLQSLILCAGLILKTGVDYYFLSSFYFWILILIPVVILFISMAIAAFEASKVFDEDPATVPGKNVADYFVSIHVPVCNEEPAMVIEVLERLNNLSYQNYEVIIIDNNTGNDDLWQPVAAYCAGRARLRFYHQKVLAGYKSGALNFALRKTAPEATIIGVVDADYLVSDRWLSDLTSEFADPATAIVQAPQAYRNYQGCLFKTMMRDEYEAFFQVGMVQRARRNAAIQHGTMTLIRRSALEEVGSWSEWCITEDAELGLRILMAGYQLKYSNQVYGRGLLPIDSMAYLRQRFRWVYGSVRIVLFHKSEFFLLGSRLSFAQKINYLAGWFPWFAELTMPLFVIFGVIVGLISLGNMLYFPPIEFAYPILLYFVLKIVTVVLIYSTSVRIGFLRILLVNFTGMALSTVISFSVFFGLLNRNYRFDRTDKSVLTISKQSKRLFWKFFQHKLDCGISLFLFSIAVTFFVQYGFGQLQALVWGIALIVLSLPGISRIILLYAERRGVTLKKD